MLEHAKVIWVIRTSFIRNQRHWTHTLCWNMQMLFEWSEYPFEGIRGTRLTFYVGTCKYCLSDQTISPEKSDALDSPTMLEHANVVWVIRTSLLRNQRYWTHYLCWDMQRLFKWSGYPFWETRATRLTHYIGTCKGCLSDQDIPPKKSEALDSHAMYVRTCKGCLSHQNIPPEKSEALNSHPMLEHAKVIWVIRPSLPRNQRHGLTHYVGTCKGSLSDQNIPSEKSEALDSQTMLEHARVVWVIRTSLLKNQRHWTHPLYKGCLSDQDIPLENSKALDSHAMLEHKNVVWVI